MTRKQIGAILGVIVLAVAAPLLTLAVLRGLDGSAQASVQQTYTKVSMPDLGQHSHSWCWVAAAANSFRWYCENTPDGAEDGLCGGQGHPWLAIDADSTNSQSVCGAAGMSWYDYRDGAPAPDDGSTVLGYDTLLKKIAETTFKDANQNGIQDPGEDNYCYSEGVEKWDYLVGLRDYVAAYGADLWVHDIIDPARCAPPAPYYLANRSVATASVRTACPAPVGVSQQVRPPTLQDYMYELSRSQDVLLWMDPVASLDSLYYQSEPYSHVVTGVGYDNTAGAGAYQSGVVTISDPWTSTTNPPLPPIAATFHNDSLAAPWQGKPSHNTSGTHNATDPYNACDVALTNPFVIQCYHEDTGAPQLWQVVDMIFVSPTGSADIKVLDFWTDPPYVYQESYPDIWTPITATEVKHNNGPDNVVAYVEWSVVGANVPGGDPNAPNVRWRPADTGDICTFQDAVVDCTDGVDAPGQPYDGDIDDIEFQVTLPVSEQVTLDRTLEVECKAMGVWVLTLRNEEYPPEGIDDPDMTNNSRSTELTVFCAVTPIEADKNVSSIDVDISKADNDPLDDDLDINTSDTVTISVTSNDENLSMDNGADTLITFLANVPEDCEGQWIEDPTGGLDWRHEYEKYDPQSPLDQAHGYEHRDGLVPGDGDTGSCGTTAESALHFQHYEDASSTNAYIREFELHCSLDGTYSFHFCNKAEVKAPVIDLNMNNNWKCQYLDVTSTTPVQTEVDLKKADLYVKPFYCGDSDMDGMEDGGHAGGTAPWMGNCCDNVDNDGDTDIDGRDDDCQPYINEDPVDGSDDDGDTLIDEDPGTADVGCPFDGNDDCDEDIDEDPKDLDQAGYSIDNDSDDLYDEDPANGFLGIDNDRDGYVDEDGAGRFDWDGDTVVDDEQFEGVDDDGDTQVDEDPLDSPIKPAAADPLEVVKWEQEPDLAPTGLDVMAVGQVGYTLAADFLCTESGEITQIDFWGSWWHDSPPYDDPQNEVYFDLSIHEDVPPGEYSYPGTQVWGYTTDWGECTATLYAEDLEEGFLIPDDLYDPTGDSMIWLYSCPIPDGERFPQEEGNIYWLDVTAWPSAESYFGWKTSLDYWYDNAVYFYEYDAGNWYPLYYPEGHTYEGESIDLAFRIWGEGEYRGHEPHYLIKELLVNLGPDDVLAWDTKELDAPAWRADALEDGFTTCNDGLDNDDDDYCDTVVDACWPLSEPDPECLDEHIGEEESGLHACNDGLDNGSGFETPGDGLIDELDDDCETLTEVSVECAEYEDVITVKEGVPWYIKPVSDDDILLDYDDCARYYDSVHRSKCVPCKIPAADYYAYHTELTPPADMVTGEICGDLVPDAGYCIAVDSVPGVYKELDVHQEVYLPYLPYNLHLVTPPYVDPADLGDPMGSTWRELYPTYSPPPGFNWIVTSWEDNDLSEDLSVDDQIDMTDAFDEKTWFHVDEVTETVCLEEETFPGMWIEVLCIEPIPPGSISDPFGDGYWQEKWPEFNDECTIIQWTDNGDTVLSFCDDVQIECTLWTEPLWLHVSDVTMDIWVTEKVLKEHQFDLSCEGEIGQHKFIIQNEIQPLEGTDPNQDNNELEMELLVECLAACASGLDSDGDTFNDDIECYLPTDSSDDCTDNVGVHDAWPLDINMDKKLNILGDVLQYRGRIGSAPGDPNWLQRLDLNMDSKLNILGDVLKYRGHIGETCI